MSISHQADKRPERTPGFPVEFLPQREFDQLTELAALICLTPIAIITLFDGKRLFFKSSLGLSLREVSATDSLCAKIISNPLERTMVSDLRKEEGFKSLKVVTEKLSIVFYLGVPLTGEDGILLGTLCVMDHQPRVLEQTQLEAIDKLAMQVVSLIEHSRDKLLLQSAKQELMREHMRLQNIIGATEVGTWEWQVKTGEMLYSPGWAEMLGYSLEELGAISRKTRNFLIHPDDLVSSEKKLKEYLSGNSKIYQCEVRMKHKQGQWVWVLDRGQVMSWDEEGLPEVMFGTHTDITSQVATKEQLAVREKKFRTLIENSDDAFAILDLNGKPTYVSASIGRVLGYTEQEAVELNLFEVVHPEDREKVAEHFKSALQKPGIPIAGHTGRVRHKDGSWRWLSATITSMLHDPVINGIIDNFKDVTEEVLAEQKLVQSERRFKKLALEGADLITVVNPTGNYLYLSPNYQNYLGPKYESFLGKNAFELIHPDDLYKLQEEFRLIGDSKQIKSSPFRFFHFQEQWRWVRSVATNLLDDPDIQGIVINTVDISETVNIQNQLQRSNERFELVLKAGSESIYDYDPNEQKIFLSQSFHDDLGLEIRSEKENFQTIYDSLHPEDRDRAVEEFLTALADPNRVIWEREYRLRKGDGQYAYIRDRSIRLNNDQGETIRVVGAMRDVTKEYISQKLDEYEKELIENSLGEDANEKEIYTHYLRRLESLFPNMKGSIVKIIDGKLSNFASPSLDPGLVFAIQGLPIGVGQGSCGTAAFLNKKVLVQNVLTDPNWEKYRELAEQFGIGACWSFPIQNSEGQVVATIANYFNEEKKAYGLELSVLERAHRFVGIVMAKFSYLEKIHQDNERYEIVNKSTNEAIFDWDVKQDQFTWGDSLRRVFGHDFKNKTFSLENWVDLTHPSDRGLKDKEWAQFMALPNQDRWENQFRLRRADGTYAYVEEHAYMVRDQMGHPLRMVGVLRDRTEQYVTQIRKKSEEKIAHHFRQDLPLDQILKLALDELRSAGGWDAGEIWIANKETSQLILGAATGRWAEENLYIQDPEPIEILQKKNGFPSLVMENHGILYWNDLANEHRFIRKDWATKFGLKSGVGLPFVHGDQVLGVCLLFGKDEIYEKSSRFGILKELIPFIGSELRRKQQEEELQLFFSYSPDILAIASPRGHFSKVNPAFCKLLGYTEEELTSVPFTEFLHPDDLNQTQKEFDETATGERLSNNFVNRYRTKSGDYRHISWSSSDVFGPSQQVFAYGRDVTEFKKMEELLQNASQLSRVGGWEVDFIRDITHWSRVTREIHELDEFSVTELDQAINFYREDFRAMVAEKVGAAVEWGEPFDFEAVIVTAKGNERWVRAIGNAERVQGKTHRIFGSIQDIHANKVIEERLRGISDNVPGAIFQYVLKPDGTDALIYVSKGSQLIWGLTPEECMEDSSKIWSQVAGGGDMPALQQSILDSAASLEKWNFEWRVLTKDGQVRWHHGMGTPTKKLDGTVIWDSLVMDVTERKHLEFLLEQSAKMAKIGSWEIDARTEPLYLNWSKTTADIIESELDGIILTDAIQVYSKDSQEIVKQGMYNLLTKGAPFDLELLLTTGKGKPKWVRCLGQAQLFDGKVVRAFGSFQDIHDRKLAELELKRLFHERDSILESIGDGFFALDRNWTVTYWNHQAELLLHVPKEVIIGKGLWEVFNQEADTLSYTKYHQAMETGETIHFEEFYDKLDTWFSISAFPSPSGLTVYFKDITAAKLAEQMIRESNERFEKAAQATNDAIWDCQIESNQIYWGKGFQSLFGYDLGSLGQTFEVMTEFIHPEDRENVLGKLLGHQKDPAKQSWNDEYRFRKSDGTYAFVINRATFIRNEKGRLVRIIGAITDLTERKRQEESLKVLNQNLEIQAKELAISNAELEQFAYVASHDLQEPLRMVSSFLSQLERKYQKQLDDKAKQYIRFAVDGAVRMRQIILDLLEFSRIGKHEESLEWIDIPEVIQEISQLQRSLIEESKGEVVYSGCEGFFGYKTPTIQLLQNLIGNGLKYHRKGISPKVEVSCEDQGESFLFTVKDNGLGIKEEYFQKIFVIFQRLHAKEEFQGTGIGLAIVKKIVDNLGGKIWLESKFGEGTVFYFILPKKLK
jgi:PAS domain S-box-containing protein